jgi:hypothetical protein
MQSRTGCFVLLSRRKMLSEDQVNKEKSILYGYCETLNQRLSGPCNPALHRIVSWECIKTRLSKR